MASRSVFKLYSEQNDIGKRVKGSKKRVRWRFCVGQKDSETHEVVLIHSLVSQKKVINIDGREVMNSKKASKQFGQTYHIGNHLIRVEGNLEGNEATYELLVDGVPFERLQRFNELGLVTPESALKKNFKNSSTSEKKKGTSSKGKHKSSKKKESSPAAPRTSLRPVQKPTQQGQNAQASGIDFSWGSADQSAGSGFDMFAQSSSAPTVQTSHQRQRSAPPKVGQQQQQQPADFDVFSSNIGRQPTSQEVLNLGVEFSDLSFEPIPLPQNQNHYDDKQDSDEDTDSDASDEIDAWKRAQELVNQQDNILLEKPKIEVIARPQPTQSLNELASSTPAEEKKPAMIQRPAPSMNPMQMQQQMMMQQMMMQQMQQQGGMAQMGIGSLGNSAMGMGMPSMQGQGATSMGMPPPAMMGSANMQMGMGLGNSMGAPAMMGGSMMGGMPGYPAQPGSLFPPQQQQQAGSQPSMNQQSGNSQNNQQGFNWS